MNIGVLGGSFDPPHYGHLKIARRALKKLSLDIVLFVPCSKHTLKGHQPIASDFDRANMVALLTAGQINFIVEPMELLRGGISYTVETLDVLKTRYGNGSDLYFLMGDDSYENFSSWKDPQKIREYSTIVVFPRKYDEVKLQDCRDKLIKMKRINISSSQIREKIEKNNAVKRYVPELVYEYLLKRRIYRRVDETN
jgi:nicotinate-nucleotide adenylyltransferase